MAIKTYFFNARKQEDGSYDRTYNAEDITSYLDGFVGHGVFPYPSDCLQVMQGTDMNIIVKAGAIWCIGGYKLLSTSDYVISLDSADVSLNRIDRVVVKCDLINRTIDIVIKKGTLSSNPVAPNVLRTDAIQEYSLATILINKQTTQITNSHITDTRFDSSVCGVVQGVFQQLDTSSLWVQWETAFTEWFDGVKTNLTVPKLTRLTQTYTTTTENEKNINIGISTFVVETDMIEVFINGFKLKEDEFTYTQSQVTLIEPLTIIGTEIEIIVIKSTIQ